MNNCLYNDNITLLSIKRPKNSASNSLSTTTTTSTSKNVEITYNLSHIKFKEEIKSNKLQQNDDKKKINNIVPNTPYKIFIANLPISITREQLILLTESFGTLEALHLVINHETNQSKGYGFFCYKDSNKAIEAINGLNNMMIANRKIICKYATIDQTVTANNQKVTTCLELLNMVTIEELNDDEEYNDIIEDIQDEMMKYGQVIQIYIPKVKNSIHLGKIFIQFNTIESCQIAYKAMSKKKFSGKQIIANYIQEIPNKQ